MAKVVVMYWQQPTGVYVVAAYKGGIETATYPLDSKTGGRSAKSAKVAAEKMAAELTTQGYTVTIEKA